MDFLSSFINFYNNLSSDGLLFFWVVIFLFCFLIFLSIVLVVKNKKLVKLLNEENDIQVSDVNDDVTPLKKVVESIEENIELVEESTNKENIYNEEVIELLEEKEDIKENIEEDMVIEESGPYSKNVLRAMSTRGQTSPISIVKEDVNYGINESYLREESLSPLEDMDDLYEVNDNMKFASEIVDRMEEEIKPSNIELTDYEKKQEEEAIISYDELLKVKDKIYNITEEEETDEFIDELKSFRLDL